MTFYNAFPNYVEQAKLHVREANKLKKASDFDAALQECNKALEIDPCSADAFNFHGVILEAMGYRREAVRAYKQAINFDPALDAAKENLSALKTKLREQPTGGLDDLVRHDLITIATFTLPTEAYVHRGKLESEGIFAFVADDNIVTMNWLYSNAVGGVKLQVEEPDVQRALDILNHKEAYAQRVNNLASSMDQPQCPRCRSLSTNYETFDTRVAFISHLVTLSGTGGIPIPFFSRKWKCNNCNYRFKLGEQLWDVNSNEVIEFNRKHARLKKWVKRRVRNYSDDQLYYYCVKCGKRVEEYWHTCPYCGDSLEEITTEEPSGDFVCAGCEKPVSEKWEACPHCREQLVEFMGYYCSECGTDVENDWRVCPHCGSQLDETE